MAVLSRASTSHGQELWLAGEVRAQKAEEAKGGPCSTEDMMPPSCLPPGRMGLGLKRFKVAWRGRLRAALLLWVLGRSVPFLWPPFPNPWFWGNGGEGVSHPDSLVPAYDNTT